MFHAGMAATREAEYCQPFDPTHRQNLIARTSMRGGRAGFDDETQVGAYAVLSIGAEAPYRSLPGSGAREGSRSGQ